MQPEHEQELVAIRHRVAAATSIGDQAAMIGHAKELLEAVAKIVMTERSVTYGDQTKAPEIVTKALLALDLPPRLTDPGDDELDRIVSGLWEAGKAVFDLRNRAGIGHGRSATPPVTPDLAALAVRSAEVWVDWAMMRLERLRASDVDVLIDELRRRSFHSGMLTSRLTEVRLPALDPSDQQRLGVAVGHRCRGETFVVIRDGLDAVIADLDAWPRAYRTGLVEGLLLNAQGQLHPTLVAKLAVVVPRLDRDDWEAIVDEAAAAPWAAELTADPDGVAHVLGAQMIDVTPGLPTSYRGGWTQISSQLHRDMLI